MGIKIKKIQFLGIAVTVEIFIIASISFACFFSGLLFYFFYNVIYGLLLSVLFPLVYVWNKKEGLEALGIAPLKMRQFIVIAVFVIFSIGGQAIPIVMGSIQLQWNYLVIGFVPLVMTTFFEKLFFRAFLQTRLDKLFGAIPAVILSGLFFSLYHLGYPGFRSMEDIVLLFAVGTGFALAYKLSGNNLAVSYLVNLPNALLTYLLKYGQFPVFNLYSVIFAAISIAVVCIIMYVGIRIMRSNDYPELKSELNRFLNSTNGHPKFKWGRNCRKK